MAAIADPGNGPSDTTSVIFWSLVLVFVGIPGFIIMALIATVLLRR